MSLQWPWIWIANLWRSDCGHCCCDIRHNDFHRHLRSPEQCRWCEATRLREESA